MGMVDAIFRARILDRREPSFAELSNDAFEPLRPLFPIDPVEEDR